MMIARSTPQRPQQPMTVIVTTTPRIELDHISVFDQLNQETQPGSVRVMVPTTNHVPETYIRYITMHLYILSWRKDVRTFDKAPFAFISTRRSDSQNLLFVSGTLAPWHLVRLLPVGSKHSLIRFISLLRSSPGSNIFEPSSRKSSSKQSGGRRLITNFLDVVKAT
jgi:hypothetical protein